MKRSWMGLGLLIILLILGLVDGGADGQLNLRPQPLDGLGHDVGAAVPVGLAVLGIFKGVQIFVFHKATSKGTDMRYWTGISHIFDFGARYKQSHP